MKRKKLESKNSKKFNSNILLGDKNMVQDYSITIEDQKIKLEQHPVFEDSLKGAVEFSNGYGISIITRKPGAVGFSSYSACGSLDKDTYEVAITKNQQFYHLHDLEDSSYHEYDGIWRYLSIEEVTDKYNFIKNL